MTSQTRIPSFCTQCRSRCGCEAVVEDGRLVGVEPAPAHPSGAKLCPKGKAAPELIYHPDRLTRPLRRVSPKGAPAEWREISWDAALDEIAGHMARIRDAHGPEQVAFGVTTPSGTHISDGISWIERFIRAYGSPNTIYSTEICNWHKDVAARLTYGWDIGTPDFARADCVMLWGHNPAATWLARSVEAQKAMKRGAKLIVVDPRPTLFARRADCWLQVRPGTDQALALGLAHLMLERRRFDAAFAREWTNAAFLVREDNGAFLRASDLDPAGDPGHALAAHADGASLLRFDLGVGRWLDDPEGAALIAERALLAPEGELRCRSALALFAEAAAAWTPERTAEATGVTVAALEKAVEILGESPSVAYYAWNGVGQSVTASQTDRAISILYGLTGSYGAPGGNVPGAAAPFADISGQDLLTEAQRAKALGLEQRPIGPGRSGWVTARDVYQAVLERDPYPVRMLFGFGGNLLSSQPDTARAKAAMAALEFQVHCDFFLNASAEQADIVLPVSTSWEREGLRTGFDASLDGLRRAQLRPAAIAPVGEARSDTEIVLALAERLGLSALMFDGDVDKGHDAALKGAGLDVATLRARPEGVEVAGEVALRPYLAKGFPTPSRRLQIYAEELIAHGYAPIPRLEAVEAAPPEASPFPLRLGCAKTLSFCHSQHRNIPSLRKLTPDPALEMAPATAAARGVAEGDWIEISTRAGSFIARAKLVAGLAGDAVFAQHGWTVPLEAEAARGDRLAANMNAAVPTDRADPISGSIPLRASWCEVRRL